eukprot:gene10044-2363_t
MFVKRINQTISKSLKTKSYSIDLTQIPLSTYFPSTPSAENVEGNLLENTKQNKLTETVLENGITVKSSESNKFGQSVLSVVVNVGSRNETYKTSGISHFVQRFFFDNTNLRTRLRLCSEMDKTGATVTSSAGREEITYKVEGLEESVPKVFELMTDSIFNGRLHPYDLPPKKELVKLDIEQYSEVPEIVLNEALHRAAFDGPLGNPLVCPPHQLGNISTQEIANFMNATYSGNNVSIVGTNIPHQDLVELSQTFLSEVPKENVLQNKKTTYKGGDAQVHVSGVPTEAILAFKGVEASSTKVAAISVLSKLVGGASKEGTDPTTKGKGSLLYRKVISNSENLVSGEAYHLSYSDAGIFAVHLKGDSQSVGTAVFQTKKLLEQIAGGSFVENDLVGAKNQALLQFYTNLESNSNTNEFFSKHQSVESFAESLKSVSIQDVQKVAKEMLESKPTIASYGDLEFVPTTFHL